MRNLLETEYDQQIGRKIAEAPVPSDEDVARNARAIALGCNRSGGRSKADIRGSAKDVRIRKAKLLVEFGDGVTCACWMCGTDITFATLEQDKIWTTEQGGRYRMSNLLPACAKCNRDRHDTKIRTI